MVSVVRKVAAKHVLDSIVLPARFPFLGFDPRGLSPPFAPAPISRITTGRAQTSRVVRCIACLL
jgi:hypothetical protein